jgi:hypothetical protein
MRKSTPTPAHSWGKGSGGTSALSPLPLTGKSKADKHADDSTMLVFYQNLRNIMSSPIRRIVLYNVYFLFFLQYRAILSFFNKYPIFC